MVNEELKFIVKRKIKEKKSVWGGGGEQRNEVIVKMPKKRLVGSVCAGGSGRKKGQGHHLNKR